jgi:hypothetical protein
MLGVPYSGEVEVEDSVEELFSGGMNMAVVDVVYSVLYFSAVVGKNEWIRLVGDVDGP